MKWFVGVAVLALMAMGSGCSSSDDSGGSGGSSGAGGSAGTPGCDTIMSACMPKDDGTPGDLHDCHMLAHAAVEQDCMAQRDTCVNICDAAPGFDGGMGGMGGMGGSGG